jgi:hypothetical protein
MRRLAVQCVPPTCTVQIGGSSNGVGFSMDTRSLGPKGMNGLKIQVPVLSSTRLLVQTNLPTRHQPAAHHAPASCRPFDTTGQLAHPNPSEQQVHSRCPSVVLWTPCSGVEWGVFEPAIKGLEKRHDVQAACEPGGGGYGGVPVHLSRLHTHRTSPAQALLTILAETCCNV